jgi:ArsR family transcriptional regulator, arsenate/arsenite/antimonite-responsive transcriptional repressor
MHEYEYTNGVINMEIVEIFKALSDESRVRILNILKSKKMCACDIESILNLPQANISRHLSKLKSVGIINSEKKSQWVYFWISEECIEKYSFIKKIFKKDFNEEILVKDREKMEKYLKQKKACKLEKGDDKNE